MIIGRWRISGWMIWTVAFLIVSAGFSAQAIAHITNPNDLHRIMTTMASVSFGGACVTGFLWKLVGENSLVLIEIKNQLIASLREEHSREIQRYSATIQGMEKKMESLCEEMREIKRLNLALQSDKLGLENAVRELRIRIDMLEDEKRLNTETIRELKQMLELAERKLKFLEKQKE